MMRSAGTACALGVVLVLLVLSAGCDYVPNRDVVVVKLAPDGSTEWTKVLDAGFDDDARAIAELADGSLVVGGQSSRTKYYEYYSRLVRLSPGGAVEWDREIPGVSGEITAVIPAGEGGVAAVTMDGDLIRADRNGNVLWVTHVPIDSVWSLDAAPDEGFVVAGRKLDTIPFGSAVDFGPGGNITVREARPDENIPTPGCTVTMVPGPGGSVPVTMCTVPVMLVFQASLVKTDGNGTVAWQQSYGGYGMESAWAVLATREGNYLLAGYDQGPLYSDSPDSVLDVALLDGNGSVIRLTGLERTEYFISPILREVPGGYRMIYGKLADTGGSNRIETEEADLDREGQVTNTRLLDTGIDVFPTSDGGFISVGFVAISGNLVYGDASGNLLHARKFSADGTLEWDRQIPGVKANYVRQVIETTDGGYAVLAVRENG
jgi:hypothetical protein